MTKDRINFRGAMKHTHSAMATEDAIGMTQLRSTVTQWQNIDAERNARVAGLMKWSFDDFIVKEVWPNLIINNDGKTSANTLMPTSKSFLVRVVSEGVPDGSVAELIERKCDNQATVQFVTPVDFGCSQERFALVRTRSHKTVQQFKQPQLAQAPEGVISIGGAVANPMLQGPDSHIPMSLLPDLQYSVFFRGIRGALADVLPRLEAVQRNGFINYSHMARHGLGMFHAFESGRQLLHREYSDFLRGHVLGLTEGSTAVAKELSPFFDLVASGSSKRSDWAGVRRGIEHAIKRVEPLIKKPQTGLYHPHHALLRDLVQRASDIYPKKHDSSQVIREGVPRLVLHEKLRSVVDVHFNALASLRWEVYGPHVVVGDLVMDGGSANGKGATSGGDRLDVFEAPADHINGSMTSDHYAPFPSSPAEEEENFTSMLERVRLVQSAEEARKYTIDNVVLPVLGRGVGRLLSPTNKLKDASDRLAGELQVEGLPQMRAAPHATYRYLIARPREMRFCVFDDARGWCWESDSKLSIRPQLYEDQEGILRQPSPLFAATGKNMIARRGITGVELRSHFLKPARRSGMSCVVQMTLPRGTAITSALREVFQLATLDPGVILRLLQ
ncbi:hypothetical protein TRVL_00389 [Trypanosoma vivax]|uniref:Uncharacterized protein n=1 Tax=Trypanosoma vivax (strain Y486) TaxID=1055687 RepID=G0U3H0_TRYVY|nr:hypothetical protein TRVL_00389 [Trypanosoma vivax]CCC50827.1 conserved hypothetical protein [Trypanosoma vivax Y486]